MFRNLAANLFLHERIETTDAKAKELRRVVERILTKAIRLGDASNTAHDKLSPSDRARRLNVSRFIGSKIPRFGTRTEKTGEVKRVDLVEKIIVDLAPRFRTRPGGYTRIVKLGFRRGDNAPLSLIEFVSSLSE